MPTTNETTELSPWENLCPIDAFAMFDTNFRQGINTTNDSVYLVMDEGDLPLLEFTANSSCYELDRQGERKALVASFSLVDRRWKCSNKLNATDSIGSPLSEPEGLLHDEVKFSKWWVEDVWRHRILMTRNPYGYRDPHVRLRRPLTAGTVQQQINISEWNAQIEKKKADKKNRKTPKV